MISYWKMPTLKLILVVEGSQLKPVSIHQNYHLLLSWLTQEEKIECSVFLIFSYHYLHCQDIFLYNFLEILKCMLQIYKKFEEKMSSIPLSSSLTFHLVDKDISSIESFWQCLFLKLIYSPNFVLVLIQTRVL